MATNRLLIVGDEKEISQLIEIRARALGYQVASMNNSEKFEEVLARLKPTAVFLDISISSRDGLELIGRLAAASYQGQLVIMGGSKSDDIQMSSTIAKDGGLAMGGTLAKPFRSQAVTDLLVSLAN